MHVRASISHFFRRRSRFLWPNRKKRREKQTTIDQLRGHKTAMHRRGFCLGEKANETWQRTTRVEKQQPNDRRKKNNQIHSHKPMLGTYDAKDGGTHRTAVVIVGRHQPFVDYSPHEI